jgi:hypothetical protein
MYALARYLTGNRGASLLGGLIFTLSPFHLAMAMQYPAMACLFPIPLLVLALVHALRTQRLRDAAWAGAALALVWVTSYYYGWFATWFVLVALITAGVVGLCHGGRQRKIVSTLRNGTRFVVTRGAVMGATFLMITVPLLFNLISSVLRHPNQYTRLQSDLAINAVRPWMYILPPHDNPLFGPLTRDKIQSHLGILPVYEQSVYLGVVAVAFALVALALYRRASRTYRNAVLPLLAGAMFCGLLTLGPSIPLNVFSVSAWTTPSQHAHITGPNSLLFDLSQNYRYYGRAFIFVSVVLASLAAVGFSLVSRPLMSRFGHRGPQVLLILAAAGVVLEFTNLPPRHFVNLSSPPWLAAVRALPKKAVIIEYPDATYSSPRSLQYIYWQTREGHATVNPPETPQSQAFMSSLDDPNSFLAGKKLSKAGVDFVVVHTRLASPTFPPYQPAWPSDQLPRSAGRNNPWFSFCRSTSDAVIYRVRRSPSSVSGASIGYGTGWYPLEVDASGQWRWMRESKGGMYVYAARDYKSAELTIDLTSFYKPRTISLMLDGKRIARQKISPTEITKVTVPLRLEKGLHSIEISASPGPIAINGVLHNNDRRSVSIRAGQPRIRLSARVSGASIGYGTGWYPLEVDASGQWRWMMGSKAGMSVYAARDYKNAELNVDLTSFYKPRTVSFLLDGKRIARRKISPTKTTRVTIPLRLGKGHHSIEISASPGPIAINGVLHNNDRRSVSIRAGQLGIRLSSR